MHQVNPTNRYRPIVRALGVALFIVGIFMLGTAVISGGPAVSADPPDTPPGQDPCSHGNSNQPCREDPQALRGKDCEYHGQSGGMNEDHCTASNVSAATPTAIPNTPVPTSTTVNQPSTVDPTPTTEASATATTGADPGSLNSRIASIGPEPSTRARGSAWAKQFAGWENVCRAVGRKCGRRIAL